MDNFEGRVAVVTGAASGIGLGLATRFAQEGMKVVLADIEQPALDAAVADLTRQEHRVLGVHTDVADPESVKELARRATEAFGNVHVLCNNAGVGGGRGLLWETTLADWRWVFGVNFWGVLHGLQTFVPMMLAHGEEGYIVNTASMAGVTPGAGPYTTTKHAVVSLSEGLYQHLRMVQARIGTSVLCPGWVRTNLLDSERNRPADQRPSSEKPLDPTEAGVRAWVEQQVANGMAPEGVAEIVMEGMREERFWITTTNEFDLVIRSRVDHLLARSNPEAPSIV